MRRALGSLLTSLALLATGLGAVDLAVADQASQLRPINLRVAGGEDAWHADNDFRLDWDRPPFSGPITAVHYRVRDAAGAVVIAETLPWETALIEYIHLPSGRGVYTADVWLEAGALTGTAASATLRFDDARPATARPLAPAGWVAGNAAVVVRIEHPGGPLPISGIRGYAVSVGAGAGSAPCAGSSRCDLAETDLRGGIGADTISLGVLPEGSYGVRAVAVSGSGMRSVEGASASVRVDATRPGLTLDSVPRGWASGPLRVTAKATDPLSGMDASGPNGPFTALAVDGGVPRAESGSSASAMATGEGSHSVAFYARDAAGNSGEESPSRATVRIDESPPRVAFALSQDRSDPERIEATVSDALSGPDPTRGSIAVRPSGSRQPFAPLPTLASAGRLVARWDSDAFPSGTYEFRATAYDGAGNSGGGDRRANGVRMVLANPLKTPTAIKAAFGDKRLALRHYGRGISYAGRLTAAGGAPSGRLPVRIVETFAAGADSPQRTTTVQTEADGSFRAHLAPGPSRGVEVFFAGTRTLSRSGGGQAQLRVLSSVRMHASSATARIGGAPVVFKGRVSGLAAPIPASGRPVELQFRLPGGEWSEFRTVQTDPRGRFRYPYSFSDDDSRGIRFQFRAYVPAQADWPYEPAGSRPVLVTGR